MSKKTPTLSALLTTFTDVVGAYYTDDRCSAGVVMSHTPRGYCCFVYRYKDKLSPGKRLAVGKGETLRGAILSCATLWLTQITAEVKP